MNFRTLSERQFELYVNRILDRVTDPEVKALIEVAYETLKKEIFN